MQIVVWSQPPVPRGVALHGERDIVGRVSVRGKGSPDEFLLQVNVIHHVGFDKIVRVVSVRIIYKLNLMGLKLDPIWCVWRDCDSGAIYVFYRIIFIYCDIKPLFSLQVITNGTHYIVP